MKEFETIRSIILKLSYFSILKFVCFLLLISLTLNACNSVPSDMEIQASINKNVVFDGYGHHYHGISGSHDSIEILFVGKSKISNGKYEINYSHAGDVQKDITIFNLDNGKWMMDLDNDRWEIK